MQLSSRILTALAVLILAVAAVAVQTGSTGTVGAATGTIDVLNVGTCYTTDTDVFAVGACDDGDGAYNVTGRDTISETGTVYATYSHDPKTAADNPRAILKNSDLLKISIQDTSRDVRTPVLLPVGGSSTELSANDYGVISEVFKNIETVSQAPKAANNSTTPPTPARTTGTRSDVDGITADQVLEFTDQNGTKTYHLAEDMYWGTGAYAATDATPVRDAGALDDSGLTTGVEDGLTILVDPGDSTATPPVPAVEYLPMHAGDNAVIKFFGCVDSDNDQSCDTTGEDLKDLTGNAFVLDEDRGSGRTAAASDGDGTAVAPWLNVQVHNADAVLQYVVYYTSERESLIGGGKDADYSASVNKPVFTKSEKDTKSALTVRAKSDGDVSSQNLWLYETDRFSGRYEGYVQLTDADGQGPDADDKAAGAQASNWGLMTKNGSGETDAGGELIPDESAAVLGVESGPVIIEYKDTDGATQTLTIMLDTVPPDIQIDTPAHKSEDQDTSPEFAGSFNDGESGLREESFQLYVDNSNDSNENGDSTNGNLALNLQVSLNSVNQGNPYGLVNAPADDDNLVRSIEDYTGYSAASMQFGVIKENDVYGRENENRLKVDGDRFDDGAATGTFADSVRIRITKGDKEVDPYNNTIDFHAFVADVAGNIGFSDSDDAGPRFIHDYGTKSADRKAGRYNVLGWYARHIFFLDEKDPEIYQEQSVTGFYGYDSEKKKPVVNRSGILVAFDSAVDTDTIDTGTFEVTLDPADAQDTSPPTATVTDVTVEGRQVYLLLGEELASDATPSVRIASGKSVSDPAGNRLTRGGMAAFDVKDGIAPKFTVTLSGGSGTGTGAEAADMLTNKAMTITITADEEINSTPSITVVCSNIGWDSDDDGENDKDLASFVGDRNGPIVDKSSAVFSTPEKYMCGDSADGIRPQQVQSFSRPGLEWEYQWQNFPDDKALSDGKLTVVAYGRDRKSFGSLKARATDGSANAADTYNWGANTAEFNFDITNPALDPTPGDGDVVTDVRPFVLLDYTDKSTVSVTKLTVDKTDQTAAAQRLGAKRFLYWPESLDLGKHDVVVEAIDAAGNKSGAVEYSFKVAERATFDVKLIAGWNAVSLPANPMNPEIEAVFTEAIVDMVAAWDGENPEAPWSIATRMDGEWSTHTDFATLTKISARYGYWVHAQGFVTQSVALVGKGNREDPSVVPADLVEIPTNPGWNFVGVIDQDGNQTQDNYGEPLEHGEGADATKVTAGSYLGKNMRAYTWDAIRGRFDILEDADSVMIGDGIWVYYGSGIAP